MFTISKTTALGKAIRTGFQSFIGILPYIIGLLLIPEVQTFIEDNVHWIAPMLPLIVAVITYTQNKLEEKK